MHKTFLTILVITAMMLAGAWTAAMAATYRNDGSGTIIVTNSTGQPQAVRPGASISTSYVPADANMTKTAETPYFNPIVARHIVASTGVGNDQVVDLNTDETTHLLVWKVAGGNCSVFYESTSNTPAVAILRAGDQYQHDAGGRVDQLVLQFSAAGTCEVIETNEPVNE